MALGSERQTYMKPPVPATARMANPQDPANWSALLGRFAVGWGRPHFGQIGADSETSVWHSGQCCRGTT